MKSNKKTSGDHNKDWILLGFQSPPEDKALAMLVAEYDGRNVKSEILELLRERAERIGILADGKVTDEYRDRFNLYSARVRMAKKARQANAN